MNDFCMTPLNTICQNMKLKLVKNDKNFVKSLELLGDRLEVCVSVMIHWYIRRERILKEIFPLRWKSGQEMVLLICLKRYTKCLLLLHPK